GAYVDQYMAGVGYWLVDVVGRDRVRPVQAGDLCCSHRALSITGAFPAGSEVMLRSRVRSGSSTVTSNRDSTSRTTAVPSISEKPAPIQRRTPPPNGSQVLGATFSSRNRRGRYACGASKLSGLWWASLIDG